MTGMLAPLRPHQQQSLERLRQAVRDGARRVMLEAPTGFGKTVVAAHIVANARAKGKRLAFTVPTIGLIDQTFDRFRDNGIDAADMGVMQADHPWRRPHAPVQIATAQTLTRRSLPPVDVALFDEAHIRHEVLDRWMTERPEVLFIGMSATPWSRGLGKQYSHLVKAITTAELIEQGYLSPFRVFAPSHPDLSGVKIVAGDYHEGQLGERMNQPQLVADIVDTWLERGQQRPTLCFATGRDHARSIHDRFVQAGVTAAYVDANTPRDEREAIGRKLAAGAVKVVVNIGTLTTGIDWDVRCIILARPTESEILFVQIIGRGLRTADGKDDCLILDHSDTHQRLGFVTDINHDELDDGSPRAKQKAREREEDKGPLPKCCPSCAALMPPGSRLCGSCGTQMPIRAPKEADGVLAEFSGKKAKPTKKAGLAELPKEQVYGELRSIQLHKGRSDGWLAHAYQEIYGCWPRGLKHVEPKAPSFAIEQFVRHKDIAFAKSRGGAHAA